MTSPRALGNIHSPTVCACVACGEVFYWAARSLVPWWIIEAFVWSPCMAAAFTRWWLAFILRKSRSFYDEMREFTCCLPTERVCRLLLSLFDSIAVYDVWWALLMFVLCLGYLTLGKSLEIIPTLSGVADLFQPWWVWDLLDGVMGEDGYVKKHSSTDPSGWHLFPFWLLTPLCCICDYLSFRMMTSLMWESLWILWWEHCHHPCSDGVFVLLVVSVLEMFLMSCVG